MQESKSANINFRIEPRTRARLEQIAEAMGATLAVVMQDIASIFAADPHALQTYAAINSRGDLAAAAYLLRVNLRVMREVSKELSPEARAAWQNLVEVLSDDIARGAGEVQAEMQQTLKEIEA